MMKQQSPEFLLGYLFSEIERKIIKDITGRDNSGLPRKPDTYTAQIPLLWFGITRPNSSYHTTPMVMLNVECMCEELAKKLKDKRDNDTKTVLEKNAAAEKQFNI